MHVLLLGATGLIGSAIAARLRRDGIAFTAVVRRGGAAARRLQADRLLRLDLGDATDPSAWRGHLHGIDAIINAAGVLQDGGGDSTRAVHQLGPAALYAACAETGVRRIVHLSAAGADQEPLTDFSGTKHAIERILADSPLDWVILRPVVVVGRAAYGGSALFRGLAALPLLPVQPDAGRIQLVQLDDVADTVVRLVRPEAPARIALELAAPPVYSVEEVVGHYRAWLGWPPTRHLHLPGWLLGLTYRLGDLAGRLGWRPPIRSTVRREMARGALGDPSDWTGATGIVPQSLEAALAAEPASVQERWFARLYFLKPVVIGLFGLFWIATGIVSLGPGYDIGAGLMREGGAGALSGPSVVAGAIADLLIGAGILVRRSARTALIAALAISVFYLIAGSLLLPRLWEEPLGPMMKIWPIFALNLVALAILDDR